MLAELNASGSCNVRVCVPLDNLFFCTNRYLYIRCNSFFKSFLKNLAYLPLCCPVQMEGLAFRMYYHQIVRIDIYPCVKNTTKTVKIQDHNRTDTPARSRLLASGNDRKSERGTSEVWERKGDPARRLLAFSMVHLDGEPGTRGDSQISFSRYFVNPEQVK